MVEADAYEEYFDLLYDDGICVQLAFAKNYVADCSVELCGATCDEVFAFGYGQDNFTAVEDFFADQGCESLCVVREEGITGGNDGNAYKFVLIGAGGVAGLFLLLGTMAYLVCKGYKTSIDSPVETTHLQSAIDGSTRLW